jgi:exosortase/archaeosortase family protein
VLILSSIPIALLANLVRLCALIALAYYVGEEIALGFFHNWSSFFLFLLATALLLFLGRIMRCRELRTDI